MAVMMLHHVQLVFNTVLLVVVLWSTLSSSAVVNKNVVRTVDLTQSVVRVTTDVKVHGMERSKATDSIEYDIIYPVELGRHLSYHRVTRKNAEVRTLDPVTSARTGNATFTLVRCVFRPSEVSSSIKDPSKAISLHIEAVFTAVLKPFPAEIVQLQNQFVRYNVDNVYFTSPYRTSTQKTTLRLATSQVASYSKGIGSEPFSLKGDVLAYGPYTDVEPYAWTSLSVHYLNHRPFATVSHLSQQVQVVLPGLDMEAGASRWLQWAVGETTESKAATLGAGAGAVGRLVVEEVVDRLLHSGAALRGGFSRADYQRVQAGSKGAEGGSGGSNPVSPSFASVYSSLPNGSSELTYGDVLGNVATSDMLFAASPTPRQELKFRYPLFGGWAAQFHFGYVVPSPVGFLTTPESPKNPTRHRLQWDFYSALRDPGLWIERLETCVILPPGSTDVQLVGTPQVRLWEVDTRGHRPSFLGMLLGLGDCPVVCLAASNLVQEHSCRLQVNNKGENCLHVEYSPPAVGNAWLLLYAKIIAIVAIVVVLLQTCRGGTKRNRSSEVQRQMVGGEDAMGEQMEGEEENVSDQLNDGGDAGTSAASGISNCAGGNTTGAASAAGSGLELNVETLSDNRDSAATPSPPRTPPSPQSILKNGGKSRSSDANNPPGESPSPKGTAVSAKRRVHFA